MCSKSNHCILKESQSFEDRSRAFIPKDAPHVHTRQEDPCGERLYKMYGAQSSKMP